MYHRGLRVGKILKGQVTTAGLVGRQLVHSRAYCKQKIAVVVRMLWGQAALIQILYCSSLKATKHSFTAIATALSAISRKV